MKTALVTIAVVLVIAASTAKATLTFSITGVPVTPGGTYVPAPPPGSMCYQLIFTEDNGMWPVGFTIEIGDGVSPLNQVNPFGMPTIFADSNPAFPPVGAFVDWDTQFPYLSVTGPNQQVVASPACGESGTLLYGDFGFLGACNNPLAGPSVVVAQIVLPPGGSFAFSATVVEYDPGTNTWDKTVNLSTWPLVTPYPPAADADGPYTIDVGDPLSLDASGSFDNDFDITSYKWDLDDDGVFETNAGGQDVFDVDYAYLESLGLGLGGSYDIAVEVMDSSGLWDTDGSTLTIIPEPATIALLVAGGLALLRQRSAQVLRQEPHVSRQL